MESTLSTLYTLRHTEHGLRLVCFLIGVLQVFWNGDDVYAMDERSKEWEMVSLSQLLQYAKQAQARG